MVSEVQAEALLSFLDTKPGNTTEHSALKDCNAFWRQPTPSHSLDTAILSCGFVQLLGYDRVFVLLECIFLDLFHRFHKAAREPVEKSRSLLKLRREMPGTSHDVQVVNNGAAAQIEEILAYATIACPSSLPPANMGQGMFHGHPLT